MIKLFKASMMDKNNREHQLDKNKKSRKEKKKSNHYARNYFLARTKKEWANL